MLFLLLLLLFLLLLLLLLLLSERVHRGRKLISDLAATCGHSTGRNLRPLAAFRPLKCPQGPMATCGHSAFVEIYCVFSESAVEHFDNFPLFARVPFIYSRACVNFMFSLRGRGVKRMSHCGLQEAFVIPFRVCPKTRFWMC